MKEGQASRTAELVCMGRALAHLHRDVPRFSDPTARTLLSAEARARVDAAARGEARRLRDRIGAAYLERQAALMIVRTVVIDDAVREAEHRQLVILGAGLDGRAWRMPELADVTVFEVDHPDTQRVKRERLAELAPRAKDVRFVAVDFTRDSLDVELARAGHDPTKRTTWIWEGVVMYLTPADVEATLRVIASRSAKGSRLAANYHAFGLLYHVIGAAVRALGEPLRSRYTPETWRRTVERFGFRVRSDESLAEAARAFGPSLAATVKPMTHLRIAIADRDE